MGMMKASALGLLVATLAGCGGGGNVSPFHADRGNHVFDSGMPSEVRVLARATAFDRDQGVSTLGRAEVIYVDSSGSGSERSDPDNRVDDALARARQVTGCRQATHTHSQDSIWGTHVMIALSACPPLSIR